MVSATKLSFQFSEIDATVLLSWLHQYYTAQFRQVSIFVSLMQPCYDSQASYVLHKIQEFGWPQELQPAKSLGPTLFHC